MAFLTRKCSRILHNNSINTFCCKVRYTSHVSHRAIYSATKIREHRALETASEDARERPEVFWGRAAEELVWHKKWNSVLDNSNAPFTKW